MLQAFNEVSAQPPSPPLPGVAATDTGPSIWIIDINVPLHFWLEKKPVALLVLLDKNLVIPPGFLRVHHFLKSKSSFKKTALLHVAKMTYKIIQTMNIGVNFNGVIYPSH